ncbi:hypothetical protein [Marinicrinis sediminis]|uniref:Butirosin biosynthesis protein H N-terminal domain-containing protein n=1 Tax=Marinicrinis sediminis TaxID=1652465 RepID=A0ABW5RE98_9BACL
MSVSLRLYPPFVQGYLFYAYPASLIGMTDETKPWIFSHYIQMCIDPDFEHSPVPYTFYAFDYAMCPWLKVESISRKTLQACGPDPLSFFKACIAQQQCIYVYLDEYQIPHRVHYRKSRFIHENLIVGYDDNEGAFELLGFDEYMIFRRTKISYEQMLTAYAGVDDGMDQPDELHQILNSDSARVFQRIQLFQRHSDVRYPFDTQLVWESMQDYVQGYNTSNRLSMLRKPWNRAYGIHCYPYILDYVHRLIHDEVPFDIRYLHNLWEHKQLMTKRIHYMQQHQFLGRDTAIQKEFEKLEHQTLLLRNLMLKYYYQPNRAHLEHIGEALPQIGEKEVPLLRCVMEDMQHQACLAGRPISE